MQSLIRPLLFTALIAGAPAAAGFTQRTDVQSFIDEMVRDHAFGRKELETLLETAAVREDILAAISRPAEAKPWRDYRPLFITDDRIRGGVEFWQNNENELAAAERQFGVPAHIIVAILGVETRYGRHTGRYRVLDALATLAFDYPPRSEFFRTQLQHYLLMTREEGIDPRSPIGSYAGAMGQPQFMPSSFRSFAIDFDGDGHRDLWGNSADVIGSVANYFQMHGWQSGNHVATPVTVGGEGLEAWLGRGLEPTIEASEFAASGLKTSVRDGGKYALVRLDGDAGPEYWLTEQNFYVITRYNRSPLYAMAVFQLSEAIRAARESAAAAGGTP